MAADEALHALLEHDALGGAAQRVGTVEHNEALAVFRAVEQQIFERGNECIVPAADVLNIVDERIKFRSRFARHALGAGAVQALYAQAGGRVDAVGEHLACGLVAADAVLRREQKPEIADLLQNIDAAAVIGAAAGGRGDERGTAGNMCGEGRTVNTESDHENTPLQSGGQEVNFS